jgi:spore photoproduct lyase
MIREKEKRDLNNLKADYYNSFFSHIYVEKSVADMPDTVRILNKFPQSHIIYIDHYKDVFCRSRQSSVLQHRTQNLVIAKKENNLVYAGAPVCQSFGNEHFYYTSCMMNCVFDCEYCYLKGMYPSGNVVLFVNLDDIFDEVYKLLQKHPVYLCVSYDTDLLAVENIFGYTKRWVDFAERNTDLKIEIRTKSSCEKFLKEIAPSDNIIFAFTMSPDEIISKFEHKTASLDSRISCIELALDKGLKTRIAFDPMIYCKNWKSVYTDMFDKITGRIDLNKLLDISVGTFRISAEYMKNMRKEEPFSAAVQFPYKNDNGYYHYPDEIMRDMEDYMVSMVSRYVEKDKIFLWERQEK